MGVSPLTWIQETGYWSYLIHERTKKTIAPEETKENTPTKASLSKGLIIGGIIFAVLILCLILYFAFFNKNSNKKLETY